MKEETPLVTREQYREMLIEESLREASEVNYPSRRTGKVRLNDLNTARTWLGIASEQLHDLLNHYNDTLIEAAQEQREQEPQRR